jgi:hypothetical protein
MSITFSAAVPRDKNIAPEKLDWRFSIIPHNSGPADITPEEMDSAWDYYRDGYDDFLKYWDWESMNDKRREHGFNYIIDDWAYSKTWALSPSSSKENGYGPVLHATGHLAHVEQYDVNLANGNAAAIFDLFPTPPGVTYEGGTSSPAAFGKWIEEARSGALLATRPETDTQQPGSPRVIDFGQSTDDVLRKLNYLEELVDFCIQNEYDISWG